MQIKHCKNIQEWSSDMPGCVLPFFVWTASHKLSYDDSCSETVFDRLYRDFITTMEVFDDTPEFREWCREQFTHHYECSH